MKSHVQRLYVSIFFFFQLKIKITFRATLHQALQFIGIESQYNNRTLYQTKERNALLLLNMTTTQQISGKNSDRK